MPRGGYRIDVRKFDKDGVDLSIYNDNYAAIYTIIATPGIEAHLHVLDYSTGILNDTRKDIPMCEYDKLIEDGHEYLSRFMVYKK